MTTYGFVLLAHLLAATVWTGGHLVLATTVLPRALRARDVSVLLDFEQGYERIGMPALLIQVASGLWMAAQLRPPVAWLAMADAPSRLIVIKLALLMATAVTAIDARLRLIPRLSAATLPAMARRIAVVTALSVGFVAAGLGLRLGWGG